MTPAITYDQLLSAFGDEHPPLVIDVRRKSAYLGATDVLPGALRRDPETISTWAGALPRSTRVVVYCAHGRDVSQRAASELAQRGFDASFLEGGIEAGWKARAGNSRGNPPASPRAG
jgi:rhodanese-related sulfurtransferase